MWQVNAVNGSKMVVKTEVGYYRQAGKKSMDKAIRIERLADPRAVILHLSFVHEYDTGNKADAESNPA